MNKQSIIIQYRHLYIEYTKTLICVVPKFPRFQNCIVNISIWIAKVYINKIYFWKKNFLDQGFSKPDKGAKNQNIAYQSYNIKY